MTRRIEEDRKQFRNVVGGKIRKSLKKFIRTKMFPARGKNGKISITIPQIDIPHIVHGENPQGVGRGADVKPGDRFGNKNGDKQKNGAGDESSEGITISLDMEEVLKFMQNELALPDLVPKEDECIDEVKIKYNSISLVGPQSLRHTRRTMLQALKRMCSTGEIDKLHVVPGFKDPVKLITPINSDKRYRQYKEIKSPSSNALIIFARDGSGSMDKDKCDIVSDMAWWIDVWIRRFYKRVERMFVWHDSEAQEVDEEKFYRHRYGGGTVCSSALKLISQQFENRFPPNKWNIYVFYFTDGENMDYDNSDFIDLLKQNFGERIVNLVAITQIYAYSYANSIKETVDKAVINKILGKNVKTAEIVSDHPLNGSLDADGRNKAILDAVRKLLGAEGQFAGASAADGSAEEDED